MFNASALCQSELPDIIQNTQNVYFVTWKPQVLLILHSQTLCIFFSFISAYTRDVTPNPPTPHCAQLLLWAHSLELDDANNQPRQHWVHAPLRELNEGGTGSAQVHEIKRNRVKKWISPKHPAALWEKQPVIGLCKTIQSSVNTAYLQHDSYSQSAEFGKGCGLLKSNKVLERRRYIKVKRRVKKKPV